MRAFDTAARLTFASASVLRSLGFELAIRYYRITADHPYAMTPEESTLLLGLGFRILPVYQHTANGLAELTAANGARDGAIARARAEEHRQPHRTPIAFAVADFDIPETTAARQAALDYINGIDQGLARRNAIWVYGSVRLIEWSRPWPAVAGRWQAAAASAWADGRNAVPSPYADIVQGPNGVTVNGAPTIDMNDVRSAARFWRA